LKMENNSPENSFSCSSSRGGQSHAVPNKKLVNAKGQTGWQFFENFFNEMKCDEKVVKQTRVHSLVL